MAREAYFQSKDVTLYLGDALEVVRTLPSESVNCVVTSPPYLGLRDYGMDGQYGQEGTPQGYAETLRILFDEIRRVLTADGTVWLNLGDSYGKGKNLLGVPWRVAFALQDDGWTLRNDVIWAKPAGMPDPAKDRLGRKHEHVFLLTKGLRYSFDLDAIKVAASGTAERPQRRRAEELFTTAGLTQDHLDAIRATGITDVGKATITQTGTGKNTAAVRALAAEAKTVLGGYWREFLVSDRKNPGDVWTIPTTPFPDAHLATFPPDLARRCILAGCPEGGTVLDPFSGSGTTGMAALEQGKQYIGIDLNPEYLDLSLRTRLKEAVSGA